MQCVIRNIVRKSRGGISAKEQVADADILLVGRGNDCGIHLQDPRVLLHHAELTLRKGELYVAPASGADVRVNSNLTQMVKLSIGDVIKVGPYDLTLEANDLQGNSCAIGHSYGSVVSAWHVMGLGDHCAYGNVCRPACHKLVSCFFASQYLDEQSRCQCGLSSDGGVVKRRDFGSA
jgi:predicted component of type VI protein secretion system